MNVEASHAAVGKHEGRVRVVSKVGFQLEEHYVTRVGVVGVCERRRVMRLLEKVFAQVNPAAAEDGVVL